MPIWGVQPALVQSLLSRPQTLHPSAALLFRSSRLMHYICFLGLLSRCLFFLSSVSSLCSFSPLFISLPISSNFHPISLGLVTLVCVRAWRPEATNDEYRSRLRKSYLSTTYQITPYIYDLKQESLLKSDIEGLSNTAI